MRDFCHEKLAVIVLFFFNNFRIENILYFSVRLGVVCVALLSLRSKLDSLDGDSRTQVMWYNNL